MAGSHMPAIVARAMVRMLVVATLAALAVAGCGGSKSSSDAPPQARSSLVDVMEVDQLRVEFNEKQGDARLIVLLSPT
jgi:ABC-type glycerol-3-phosphate transport system substrate-binding protein